MMRVDLVDPSAFTPAYDHALASALAQAGAEVRLVTSEFAYGEVPEAAGYELRHHFYRGARGRPGSRLRQAWKLAQHVPDMLGYEMAARAADVVHFQWLTLPGLDARLLPDRPVVITAHDLLPREPRPGQARAQRRLLRRARAVVVHSRYGRQVLVDRVGLAPERVHVIPHGAFTHLLAHAPDAALPPELRAADPAEPVVLCFGLIRPYKGIEGLLQAWRGVEGGELWVVGRPMMDTGALLAGAPARVRFVPRYVSEAEQAALFRRADLVVLPYAGTERFDFSGVLATALGFGKPSVVTDVGGMREVAEAGAARLVSPEDPVALREALAALLADDDARGELAAAARAAAAGPYSWQEAARATLGLYATILPL
jgi:glycosyltransferase involved in cell wall biosynthesis